NWQIQNHQGYIKANISSIRHGPITGEHRVWKEMSQALKSSDGPSLRDPAAGSGALQNRILVICGRVDPVIVSDELEEDIAAILGSSEDVTFETVDAGHDFPATRSAQVVHSIMDFWKRSA
ncbi:MAG: hypothetical protein Q9183_003948, partial [Haloplaca sp. 2 TL-2023]